VVRGALVGLLLLAAAAGCQRRSYLRVKVTDIPAGSERLDAWVANNGEKMGPNPLDLKAFPGSTFTFSISFPEGRSGVADITVQAVKGGAVVAEGMAQGTIQSGITDVTVALKGQVAMGDMGAPDLSSPDLATPLDLTAGPDIAQPPDLGPTFEASHLKAWFRADVGVTTVNMTGLVTKWADSSGNGRDATQGNAANQPRLIQGGLNGLPTVQFDGNQRFLQFDGTFLANTNYTFVAVEARSQGDAGWVFWSGDVFKMNGGLALAYPNTTTARWTQFGGNDLDQTVAAFNGQEFTISTGVFDKAIGHKLFRNTIMMPSSNVEMSVIVGDTSKSYMGGTTLVWYHGDIAELMLFDAALADQERMGVEGYLKKKWGLK
jgi:hypothetical protein